MVLNIMTILEFGINIGDKNIIEIKYYRPEDGIDFSSAHRTNFLNAIEKFCTEVYGFDLDSVNLGTYQIICHKEIVNNPNEKETKTPITYYCIIEKDTDSKLVNNLLIEINRYFRNRFSLHFIFIPYRLAKRSFWYLSSKKLSAGSKSSSNINIWRISNILYYLGGILQI